MRRLHRARQVTEAERVLFRHVLGDATPLGEPEPRHPKRRSPGASAAVADGQGPSGPAERALPGAPAGERFADLLAGIEAQAQGQALSRGPVQPQPVPRPRQVGDATEPERFADLFEPKPRAPVVAPPPSPVLVPPRPRVPPPRPVPVARPDLKGFAVGLRGRMRAPAPAAPAGEAGDGAVDRRTELRLIRGQMAIEARLDLHGHGLRTAREVLVGFVQQAVATERRHVLVITGRGEILDEETGRIRRSLPHWLQEPPLDRLVLRAAPARARDGGIGAWYVLLRRRR